ncbi:hypothetical protein DFQ05_0038 [Winogradskyella wandonensis]|uniref:Glycine dehydrogenase n=1 Tax=Winogradskyella wandonensis TaxID=1442586 RepID=A0A4R1KV06_9FLAO|nr:hypothetical protein [Winogradskyella wandonensis]TCK68530.1 hypothetical protein DFQ05_0038 [Winogradskyella wandonensis]
MKKSILFISCEEAHHICDKNQYGEATTWEKIKLKIRLSWCKITQAYTKRNTKLTEAIKEAEADCLNPEEKTALQQAFERELRKQQ